MRLVHLQVGERFTATFTGKVTKIEHGHTTVIFDGNGNTAQNRIPNDVGVSTEVTKELPPPAVGDTFRANGGGPIMYVLRAILEDDQWVYSEIGQLHRVMIANRAIFDNNYIRTPKEA